MFSKYFNAERGIWTLAPVARPTPLAGAPLRPLEYFCSLSNTRYQCVFALFHSAFVIIHITPFFVNNFFHRFLIIFYFSSPTQHLVFSAHPNTIYVSYSHHEKNIFGVISCLHTKDNLVFSFGRFKSQFVSLISLSIIWVPTLSILLSIPQTIWITT